MKSIADILLIGLCVCLISCVPIIDKIHDKPIKTNTNDRTWGEWMDDQSIETILNVNIRKASDMLRESRIKVISYNATVLIIGQVPNQELKELASKTAQQIKQINKIHNELTIGNNLDIVKQGSDSWITSKVKASIISNDAINANHIEVNTEDSTVYLMGIVTPEMGNVAASVAARMAGVKKVVKVFEYIE